MFDFEIRILKALEGIRSGFLNKLFEYITMLGEETLFVVIVALVYLVFSKKLGQKLMYVLATSMSINGVIKNFAKVPRPFVKDPTLNAIRMETATGYSFPSGHTQTLSTWTTTLALTIKKHWATIITGVLILLVAFSRCYLGVHYPSDVVIGAILGIGSAFLFGYIFDKAKNRNVAFLITCGGLFIPCVIFLFIPESTFADFYKTFGLLVGFSFAVILEEKYADFDCKGPLWKRIVRFVVVIALALGIKSGLKALFALIPAPTWVSLLLDGLRYGVLSFVCFGVYPVLFKKVGF